jgi:predicted metal-dependent hydrolase
MQLEFKWQHPRKPEPLPEPAVTPAPAADAPRAPDNAASRLGEYLRAETGRDYRVEVTDNRSAMLTVRPAPDGGPLRLRIHHMFLDTPEDVRTALARWLRNPRDAAAGARINAHIREQRGLIRPRAPRVITLRQQGRHFELAALYAEVNRACFNNAVKAHITWGQNPHGRRRRRSIRLGSYQPAQQVIRIHPLLDQAFVPRYVVRYIVFHEMLHALLGIEEAETGRRRVHPPRFVAMERTYHDYERACAWIDDHANMSRLLRGRG